MITFHALRILGTASMFERQGFAAKRELE